MAKRVFFSFHYQDVIDFRANVVRQHWLTKPDRESAGFFDASIWGNATLSGAAAIKTLINSGLDGTSTTCVLIGSATAMRRWVRYEIMKSFRKGNGLLAVHINSIKGRDQLTKPQGVSPLTQLGVTYSSDGTSATLWEVTDGRWQPYEEIGNSASYSISPVAVQYRNKGFNLSQWYPTYDWVANGGYSNFATWVA